MPLISIMKKGLVILGSTGSIGRSALSVFETNRDRLELLGISGHSNIRLLLEQADKYKPRYIALTDKAACEALKNESLPKETELLPFATGLETLATQPRADVILNAIVGAAGLQASLWTIKAGIRLALANKESMVVGGDLINRLLDETGSELIPVDSEHSAIWQALAGGKPAEVRKILLTGSGGPFREWPPGDFTKITKEQALNHPTWNMGPKITIDSATMMNKGLEVIEAVQLFRVPPDKIEVVIHPESIIHSMVEYVDSSILAQLSSPDMRLPISHAIFYPERVTSDFGRADLKASGKLTFYEPDFGKFPLLKMAYNIANTGGTAAAVFNAANEVAVAAFLNDAVKFCDIPDIVINSVEKHEVIKEPSYEDIIEADRRGRLTAQGMIG